MMTLNKIIFRTRARFYQATHRLMVRTVLRTPPLSPGSLSFSALTMVGHKDILAYLVAIKTFAFFAPPRNIVVLCDSTVTAADRSLLNAHVPHIEFLDIAAFRPAQIPTGGCWERLLAVATLARDRYVVQLDSDTVTTGPIEEVLNAVAGREGFVMGGKPKQQLETVPQRQTLTQLRTITAQNAECLPSLHIHQLIEYYLPRIGLDDRRTYTNGWAAFTGFPPDDTMQMQLFDVVERLRIAMGDRLNEWGSEMATSNYLVSNSQKSKVLPYPKYCTPMNDERDVHLWHFVGFMRYNDMRYATVSRNAVRKLLVRDSA